MALASWVGASVAVGLLTFAAGRAVAPAWASDPGNLAIVITAETYALLTIALLLIVGGGERHGTALALRPASGRQVLSGVAALVVTYGVSALGYATLEAIASPDPSAMHILLGIGSDGGRLGQAGFASAVLIMTRILVLVPLGEELLFRGALFGWLRRKLSAPWTIAVTALLFAVIHQFPIIFPLAFLWGVAMGWVREHTGSVVPGIVAHGINGLVLMIVSFIASGWTAKLPFGG